MHRSLLAYLCLLLFLSSPLFAKKVPVHALYIPLADHYAAIVALERYGKKMKHAKFSLTQMKNWDLLRAYFQAGEVDMAYAMTPLAIDMYNEKPHFKWIGLMHRDGNALAVNELIYKSITLPKERIKRKPNAEVALKFKELYKQKKKSTLIGLPHLLSTHAVVLYRYLDEHGSTISFTPNKKADLLGIYLAPPKAPAFIKIKNKKSIPAAFEQSLPWADVVETQHYGKVAWYSKDVMPWPDGHVECIALATDEAILKKEKAVQEVMRFIKKSGKEIEAARTKGGRSLQEIVEIIHKHIPAHTREAIHASLDPTLRVINYQNLNIDKAGLKQIMDFAVEGGIIKQPVDIDRFADTRFNN